jgi:hypothetical protein
LIATCIDRIEPARSLVGMRLFTSATENIRSSPKQGRIETWITLAQRRSEGLAVGSSMTRSSGSGRIIAVHGCEIPHTGSGERA